MIRYRFDLFTRQNTQSEQSKRRAKEKSTAYGGGIESRGSSNKVFALGDPIPFVEVRTAQRRPLESILSQSHYGAPNAGKLLQMQEVMAGIQSNHMLDALLSPLGMHADAFEIFVRHKAQQPQIHPA